MNKNIKIALFICFFLFLFVVIVALVLSMLKGDAYELSLEEIDKNDRVVSMLGRPLRPGFFVLGKIHVSGQEGETAIKYSINGSLKSAKVFVNASKYAGLWELDDLVVSVGPEKKQIVIIARKE